MSGRQNRMERGKKQRREDDDAVDIHSAAAQQRRTLSPSELRKKENLDKAAIAGNNYVSAHEQKIGRKKGAEDESESDWEDVDSDDEVDERFDNMEREEIIDDGLEEAEEDFDEEDDDEADGDDEDDEARAKDLDEKLRRVTFDDEGDDEDEDGKTAGKLVWRSDKNKGAAGESMELEYSNKAYDSFFQLRTEYPCLSFDIIKDGEGANRTKYPLSMYFVCGSQADEAGKNQLYVMKISNICKTKNDLESDEDEDDEDEEDVLDDDDGEDEDDGEEKNNGEPIIEYRTISHFGTANRVRCNPINSSVVAVWSDAGHVQVFNIDNEYQAMANFSNWSKEQARAWDRKKSQSILFASPSNTHKTEGYALDWSSVTDGAFASGDCNGSIFVWQPAESRWAASCSNTDGTKSVEEIKWSPLQDNYFVCGRSGGKVEVWDTRDMRKAQVSWRADPTDINVCDWNKAKQASHLLVTGADSGVVSIWDLRKARDAKPAPLQQLTWHTDAITSVQFSSHNESVLSVTGHDGQCTLWDLTLERDPDEEKEIVGDIFGREDIADLPDQLMFQHQGLKMPKEAHFHSQIPGLVVTTDYLGLHIFKPMNWRSLMK